MKKLIISLVVLCAPALLAQETWNQSAFANRTTSGRSVIFRNINQSSHWITYCANAFTNAGTIEIDGSADGVNWITISNLGSLQANTCGAIQGGGYYPNISASIIGLGGAGPSVTATYSASTGAIATPSNTGFATSTQPVTFVPIPNFLTNSALKSTAEPISSFANNVLYGATVYNPNSGTVFLAFGGSSTPFVGGGTGVYMIPVAAGQTISVSLPPQGLGFTNAPGLYMACSTSSTSAADPTTGCVVSAYWKQISNGIVPN